MLSSKLLIDYNQIFLQCMSHFIEYVFESFLIHLKHIFIYKQFTFHFIYHTYMEIVSHQSIIVNNLIRK